MKTFLSILFSTLSLVIFAGKLHSQDDGKTFNRHFITGSVPDIHDFEKLTSFEEKAVEIFGEIDFRNNRSRIFTTYYKNGKPHVGDSVMSNICACTLEKDSLFIQTSIGFFGGAGYQVKIWGEDFQSMYAEWADDSKPYKYNLTDSTFCKEIIVDSKFQYLILDKKPDFKPGQQLSGYLSFTSNQFYERSMENNMELMSTKSRFYFTCQTKSATRPFRYDKK